MASLLIRTVNGENPQRYMDGDVVAVVPDDHVWGRMESLVVWVKEGNAPELWPGKFVIVTLPDLSVAAARQYVAEETLLDGQNSVMGKRRTHAVDYRLMERRDPLSGRDTLNLDKQITRNYAEVASLFKAK